MIKILLEFEGKEYKAVPSEYCKGCSFNNTLDCSKVTKLTDTYCNEKSIIWVRIYRAD